MYWGWDFETKTEHLDKDKRRKIYDLIDKYDSLFAKNRYDVGMVSEHEARIKLMENKYVAEKYIDARLRIKRR